MSIFRPMFRPVPLATAALSAAALVGVPVPADAAPAASVATEGRPLVIGHRGAAGTAPENTVAGFKDARAAGVDHLEIGVQLSADGVPFLFQDRDWAKPLEDGNVTVIHFDESSNRRFAEIAPRCLCNS